MTKEKTPNSPSDTASGPEGDPNQADLEARRASVRQLLTVAGVAGASSLFLPQQWTKPVIGSVVLPAHGQTSPGGGPTAPPSPPAQPPPPPPP